MNRSARMLTQGHTDPDEPVYAVASPGSKSPGCRS